MLRNVQAYRYGRQGVSYMKIGCKPGYEVADGKMQEKEIGCDASGHWQDNFFNCDRDIKAAEQTTINNNNMCSGKQGKARSNCLKNMAKRRENIKGTGGKNSSKNNIMKQGENSGKISDKGKGKINNNNKCSGKQGKARSNCLKNMAKRRENIKRLGGKNSGKNNFLKQGEKEGESSDKGTDKIDKSDNLKQGRMAGNDGDDGSSSKDKNNTLKNGTMVEDEGLFYNADSGSINQPLITFITVMSTLFFIYSQGYD